MENNWKYKIDLKTNGVFDSISKKYGISFPEELKQFIIERNAASPDNDCVDINGVEHVYTETLSFNENDTEGTLVFPIMDLFDVKKVIPFARDPFGNYFCFSLEKGTIIYYEHEEQTYEDSGLNLSEFLQNLHK